MNTDRDIFMCADDFPVTLDDGIIITVHDDPEGYLSAGDDPEPGTEYVGVTVEDPDTGAYEGLWSIDILPSQSGHDVREYLWSHVLDPSDDGYYALLRYVRLERDIERDERADAAACDIITL